MNNQNHPSFSVFLLDIRSTHNAGAIMRTADAVGASEVIFAGYTPTPKDRFGRIRAAFVKASLGSEKSVAWRHVEDAREELAILKSMGHHIVVVEQSADAIDYKQFKLPSKPIVVVFGNEVDGVPGETCALAHTIAEIPMRGKKESLNVSVSAGIVLFRWFDGAF